MALLLLALTMHWMSAPMAAAQNLGDYAAGAPGAAARPNATAASATANNTAVVNGTAGVDSLQEVPGQLPETPVPVTTPAPETTAAPTLGVPEVTLAPSTKAPEPTAPEPTTKSPTFVPEIETASPTVAATTKLPWTGRPTTMPTLFPTTSPPTVATPPPVAATEKPTAAPSKATMAPAVKTDAPSSKAPTTFAPTMTVTTAAPTAPTVSPTVLEPTEAPTLAPTGELPTTKAPSMMPTAGPTSGATEEPTFSPTVGTTTLAPTVLDVITTGAPTSEAPTTEAPTTAAGTTPVLGTIPGLEMTLVGMNSLMDEDAKADWVSVTNDHIKGYFTRNAQLGITAVETNVQVIQQNIISVERRRQLQLRQPKFEPEDADADRSRRLATASILVQYSQELAYSTADADRDTMEVIALAPFQTLSDLDDYVATLQDTNVAFSSVQRVQDVGEDTGGPPTPSASPITGNDSDKGGMSTGAIIGIVVGCVGALLLVGGVGYFVSQRGDDGGYVTTGKTPPNELDVGSSPDEVSTLAEPHTIRNSSGMANTISGDVNQSGSGGGYGDQRYVCGCFCRGILAQRATCFGQSTLGSFI